MIELPFAEGAAERFELRPDPHVTRKSVNSAAPPMPNAFFEITKPMVTLLTEDLIGDDRELAAFWKVDKRQYDYHYVSFRFTLSPGEAQTFEKAWLTLELKPGDAMNGPFAYSMAPDQVVDVSKVKQSAKLGAKLQFVTAEMGGEAGHDLKEYVVRAYAASNRPSYWEFRKTTATELAGTFRLHVVTRTAAGIKGTGCLTGKAVASTWSYVIFRREMPVGEPARVEFALRA